jgi:hypothetical protein
MDVLSEAIEDADKGEPQVRAHLGNITPEQVKRYFRRESFPTALGVERYVAAIALETGKDQFALWKAAIKRAEKAAEAQASDADPVALLRAAAALEAETKRLGGKARANES